MVKSKKYAVVVYNNDYTSFSEAVDIVSKLFGYDPVQAESCAHLINKLGKYPCKYYKDKESAIAAAEYLVDCGFEATVVS